MAICPVDAGHPDPARSAAIRPGVPSTTPREDRLPVPRVIDDGIVGALPGTTPTDDEDHAVAHGHAAHRAARVETGDVAERAAPLVRFPRNREWRAGHRLRRRRPCEHGGHNERGEHQAPRQLKRDTWQRTEARANPGVRFRAVVYHDDIDTSATDRSAMAPLLRFRVTGVQPGVGRHDLVEVGLPATLWLN
jgi:hypothetical protein